MTTVAELRKQLEQFPDDLPITTIQHSADYIIGNWYYQKFNMEVINNPMINDHTIPKQYVHIYIR